MGFSGMWGERQMSLGHFSPLPPTPPRGGGSECHCHPAQCAPPPSQPHLAASMRPRKLPGATPSLRLLLGLLLVRGAASAPCPSDDRLRHDSISSMEVSSRTLRA